MPHSIIPLFSQNIDNRLLSLDVHFYMLRNADIKQLAAEFMGFVRSILPPDIILRSQWGRKAGFHLDLQKEIDSAQREIEFSFEADFVSTVVYNTKTFRQFDKRLKFECHPQRSMPDEYALYYKKLFSSSEANEKVIQQSLVELFSISGRVPSATYTGHDISGFFHSTPYWKHPHMQHGKFRFTIAKECLKAELPIYADRMATFLEDTALELHNIGGTVRIAPHSYAITPYMYYFGNQYVMDGSHESAQCYPNEWYPFYYHNGIEWFNLLTPLAASKLTVKAPEAHSLICKDLENGGQISQMRKSIGEVDIPDYSVMKDHLYNALIPGISRIPLNVILNPREIGYLSKPRMDWECLPIHATEICIENNDVIFKHQS